MLYHNNETTTIITSNKHFFTSTYNSFFFVDYGDVKYKVSPVKFMELKPIEEIIQ